MVDFNPDHWKENHTPGWVNARLLPSYGPDDPAFQRILAEFGALHHLTIDNISVIHLRMDDPAREIEFAAALAESGRFEFVEPDYLFDRTLVPNDPGYPGNAGIGGDTQYYLTQIGMTAAYDITLGSASIVWGWIDTHFLLTHPDMSGKFTGGYNLTSSSATLDTPGTCSDTLFHGCLTSGIFGALTNNGSGISGVAPNCLIMPFQCAANNVSTNPSVSLAFAASALALAATNGCRGVNMSFAGTINSGTLQSAVAAAFTAGLVLVAGASDSADTLTYYPAAYPNVIAVGGVNTDDSRASYSGYGSYVNCAAPADQTSEVLSTNYASGGNYNNGLNQTGCSFAAPQVSGVVALMLSINPQLSNKAVNALIMNSALCGVATTGFTNSTVYRISASKALAGVQASQLFWTPYDNFRLKQNNGNALNLASGGATIKCALITSAVAPNTATDTTFSGASYTQVTGTNYVAGGGTVSPGQSMGLASGIVTYTTSTLIAWAQSGGGFSNARYAVLYDSGTGNLIAWGGFVTDQNNTSGNFNLVLDSAGIWNSVVI